MRRDDAAAQESSRVQRALLRKRKQVSRAAALLAGSVALGGMLGGQWLVGWAESLRHPRIRPLALRVARLMALPGEATGFWIPASWLRDRFLSWADPASLDESAALSPHEAIPGLASSLAAEGIRPEEGPPEISDTVPGTAEDGAIALPPASIRNRIMSVASGPPLEIPRPLAQLPASYALRDTAPVFSAFTPLQVLMVGDSIIGQNTQDAMTEWDKATNWAELSYSWKLSTTLVDPSRLDWQNRIRALTEEKAWDLIIVVIGSNDGQDIWKGDRNYPFNTPEWVNIYDCRARDFLSVAVDRSLKVYWTSVPPMRAPGYRDRMAMMNGHVRSIVEEFPRARWLDTAAILGNAEGRYQDTMIIDGRQKIIRMADGIHITVPGAELLAKAWEAMMLEDFIILRIK